MEFENESAYNIYINNIFELRVLRHAILTEKKYTFVVYM